MLTLPDYFMGRDVLFPQELTPELRANAQVTLDKVNALLEQFGEPRKITSGWRPAAVNAATPGAARFSRHLTCQAVDLEDHEGDLDEFLFGFTPRLVAFGLWMEHPAATKGWCHLQTVAPKSGRLVFYP